MDLDKYRRTSAPPTDPAPTLGGTGEAFRQKANRYHAFVNDDAPSEPTIPANVPKSPVYEPAKAKPELPTRDAVAAKGNKLKSNKRPLSPPKASTKQEPASQSGVKLVYLDETMRKQYIQIAGYVMLKHGVKLTMTAYFCFLHEQAVAQQSDETFLNAIAQFAQPRS